MCVGGGKNKILCLNTLFLQIKKWCLFYIFHNNASSRKTCKKN